MIESIFIIDVGSGVPLFHYDFIEIEDEKAVDKAMFSGFLKVLDDFSQETRQEAINEIKLASTRLIYEKQVIADRKLLFVSIDDQKDKSDKLRKVIESIANEFGECYKEQIASFRGQIDTFKPFEEKVKKIMIREMGSFKEKMELKKHEHPIMTFMGKFTGHDKFGHLAQLKEKEKKFFGTMKDKISETIGKVIPQKIKDVKKAKHKKEGD